MNIMGMKMIRRVLELGIREAGYELPDDILGLFVQFLDELSKWNRKVNLTAITGDEEVVAKHIVDSLHLAYFIENRGRVLDIGSGAGLPAIPLKIVRPEMEVISVDANGKKIIFQRHITRLLKLRGFEPLHARVESLHKTRVGYFDLITSRAFSNLAQFTSLAAPLLAPDGRMIAMKGPAAAGEMKDAEAALNELGYEIQTVCPYELPFKCGTRQLVVIAGFKNK